MATIRQPIISEIASPAISRLASRLKSDPSALARFWDEVERTGAPLFEEYDQATNTWLVTFVWRESGPTDNVVLLEWMRPTDFPDKVMHHLPDTDVWYDSIRILATVRTQYGFAPNDNLVPKREETDWDARRATWRTDPLNPDTLIDAAALTAENASKQSSVLSMPAAPEQPWIVARDEVARGVVQHHRFYSVVLQNDRDLWLYRHPEVERVDGPVPMLVCFDGESHDAVFRAPIVLDNLIADGEVPPMVAVFVGNVDRGKELPCNAAFVTMLVDELMSWAVRELGVEVEAATTIANGVSYGGLASMWAGLTAPDTFGMVASQSGSFWWKPEPMVQSSIIGECDEYQWLPTQAATWPRRELKIWMESGSLEGRGFQDSTPTLLDSNRHMRNVLVAQGYDVAYHEYAGGHDYCHWRSSLAEALIYLLGDLASE